METGRAETEREGELLWKLETKLEAKKEPKSYCYHAWLQHNLRTGRRRNMEVLRLRKGSAKRKGCLTGR